MTRSGQPVFVEHESRRGYWHLTEFSDDGQRLKNPPCGARASFPPAWLRYMRPGVPDGAGMELCRLCLHAGALAERAEGRVTA